ncbi:MAG TPA: transglutaminase family protein [Acidimicrobiales bacterium]|nr:transglutaminase family protein [Acidimicrobiales bacterium]
MKLDIRYRCSFEYDSLVRESQNELRAAPISDERQSVLSYKVTSFPAARFFSFEDYWGTRVDAFGVREPHIYIEVVAEATVETHPTPMLTASADFKDLQDLDFLAAHFEYLERTPHVDWDGSIAAEARRQLEIAGPDVVSVVLAIHRRAGGLLSYQPGTTYVGVPVVELIARGQGVCQDYAHLAVAMCRSVGIPARYVSGYLFTDDDAVGDDTDTDVVQVQTHAWFEAAIPGVGWLALDPTNRQEVGLRHVKIGHGRDYDDVPPLRGVYTGATNTDLQVAVEMRRLSSQTAAQQQQQ